MDTIEAIHTRRSIRKFEDKPLPFGAHRDEPLRQVEFSYIVWLAENERTVGRPWFDDLRRYLRNGTIKQRVERET